MFVLSLALALLSGVATPASDAWQALAIAPPGAERAHQLTRALRELGDEPLSRERLDLAWRIGVEESRAFRYDLAVEIQTILHESAQAPWSASDLALTLGRAGRYEEGREVLEAQLERGPATSAPVLQARLGLLLLGAGQERAARNALGRALAGGSEDAALILGRLALDQGDKASARALFRGQLMEGSGGAWALRGWGLTLLPTDQPGNDPSAQNVPR